MFYNRKLDLYTLTFFNMNSRSYKVYQTFLCLLLILFTSQSCLGNWEDTDGKEREKLVEEKAKRDLSAIEPLAKFEKEHLARLEEYIVANFSLNTVIIPFRETFPDIIPSSITTSRNTSDISTIQQSSPLKIKEEKGKEKQEEEEETETNLYIKREQEDSPLHVAINHPNTELTEHLIATNLNHIHIDDIDHLKDDKLMSLILKNIKNRLIIQANESIESLLETEVNVNDVDTNANTPLHLAATNGYLKIVECLIRKGANLKAKNQDGNTALHLAAKNGYLDIVELLVSERISIDTINNDGMMAVHLAARNGHGKVVCFLVERKSDYRSTDKRDNTILHHAVKGGSAEIVNFLLGRGFKRDVRNIKIIPRTVEGGFIPDRVSGNTPLQLAVNKGYTEIAKSLVEHGASLKALVLDNCCNASSINRGNTLLHVAAQNRATEMVQFFILDKQMNVNTKNHWDLTPLHFAAQNGCLAIVKLLVQNGAGLEAKSSTYYNTSTPLSLAVVNGHIEVADFLIEQGATLTEKTKCLIDMQRGNNEYPTLLHFAAENNDTALACLLINNGANVDIKDKNGNTPADLADKRDHSQITKILKEPFIPILLQLKTGRRMFLHNYVQT
jgi:ankyrin repeat protein